MRAFSKKCLIELFFVQVGKRAKRRINELSDAGSWSSAMQSPKKPKRSSFDGRKNKARETAADKNAGFSERMKLVFLFSFLL